MKRRRRDPERPRLRKVYILPNLFTALNLFLGLLAIFLVIQGVLGGKDNLPIACWFVVLAAVLDGLDGAVARLTHTQSSFGVEFDSLSDLVSFGVTPSVIAFCAMQQNTGEHNRLVLGVCALFAICGALRLARYNVQKSGSERQSFLGLPIPAGALCVVFFELLIHDYNLLNNRLVLAPFGKGGLQVGEIISAIFPFVLLGLALLMVSEVPYPKVVRRLRGLRHISFDSLVSLILLAMLLIALKSDLRVAVGFGLVYSYALYGLFLHVHHFLRQAEPEKSRESSSDSPV